MRIDIRSLLAATVVAAFAASTWQVAPGWAVALTWILSACGAVRLRRPEGENSYKASLVVACAGAAAILIGWFAQRLICGTRPDLLWGTVTFACLVSSLAAVATRILNFSRWMQRALFASALVFVVAVGIRYFQTRHAQFLMARHIVDVAYLYPSLGVVDLEPSNEDATPIRVRMRVLMGIAKVNYLLARREMQSSDWQAASQMDTLLYLTIERVKIESTDVGDIKFATKPRLFIWETDLNGDSLAKILCATGSASATLSCTRVASYEGLSRASSLRELFFYDMRITDQLVDELSKLPSLVRLKFYENSKPSDAQITKLKNAIPNLVIE
jgi:hypothetical protein